MTVKQLNQESELDRVSESIRQEHNRDLIRRMRNGEPLTSFDSQSSWFPPRPIIEKNQKEISRLYSAPTESNASTETTSTPSKSMKGLRIVKA